MHGSDFGLSKTSRQMGHVIRSVVTDATVAMVVASRYLTEETNLLSL